MQILRVNFWECCLHEMALLRKGTYVHNICTRRQFSFWLREFRDARGKFLKNLCTFSDFSWSSNMEVFSQSSSNNLFEIVLTSLITFALFFGFPLFFAIFTNKQSPKYVFTSYFIIPQKLEMGLSGFEDIQKHDVKICRGIVVVIIFEYHSYSHFIPGRIESSTFFWD